MNSVFASITNKNMYPGVFNKLSDLVRDLHDSAGCRSDHFLKITLPRPAKVSDLATGRIVVDDGTAFTVSLGTPETRLLKLEYR